VPNLRPGDSYDALRCLILPSGKGLNAARTARALGSEVITTGLVAGSCGQWICDLLAQHGIPERFYRLPVGESRTSTILVDPARAQTTVVHDGGPVVPPDMWPQIRHHIVAAVRDIPWVALCGSCPQGLPDDVYADLCQDLQAHGHVVGIDARDQWLAHALATHPYLVKCNQHEAGRVLDTCIETAEEAYLAAREWVALGARHVVITMGEQGAIAASQEGSWHVTAPRVQALSAVGSGDAMMAGLLVALARGDSLPTATRYGVAIGTANTLELGSACCDISAIPALFARSEAKAARP
jgi:tagatose 6-phosphate kinase